MRAKWEAYASAHARHSEAVARLEVLSAAVAQVAETLERYEWQWLGRIETGLETVVGTWGLTLGSVAFAPLEVFYSDLVDATLQAITAAASGKTEKALAILRPVLLGAVSHVTLAGLAQMLDTTAEAEAIITALADERFAYRAPLWGGASTHVQPRYQYVILPPVAAADLAALTQAEPGFYHGWTLLAHVRDAEADRAGAAAAYRRALALAPGKTYLEPLIRDRESPR